MNVPSKDIQEMLETEGLMDSTFGTLLSQFPINRATFDAVSPNCTRILDFAGRKPQLTMDLAQYEYPTVQIAVRCVDYDEGLSFLNKVVDLLHGRSHETLNGAYYSLIECMNGPTFLEREKQRTVFVSNFSIQRRPAS